VGVQRQTVAGSAIEMIALMIVWAAVIVIIHPRGNFPTQDDWHHSWPTLQFAKTGEFHMTRYTAPSLRAQVVWGALWVRAFGFSFEILRASTLALSAGALLLINRLLAALPLSAAVRWIGSLAFLFHPIFLFSSCTFMTEVPFVFTSIAAFAMIAAGIERDRTSLVALGAAAAVLSCFIRQSGAINIAAAGLLLLALRERIARRWIAHGIALSAAVAVLAIVAIFRRDWLAGSLKEFHTHYSMWSQSTFGLSEQIGTAYHYLWLQACNSALFFLPLTAPLLLLIRRSLPRWQAILLGAIAVALTARSVSLIADGYAFPFSNSAYHSDINLGQTLVDLGMGPLTLRPASTATNPGPIHMRNGAKAILTIIVALLGAAMSWAFITWLVSAAREPAQNARALLAASFVTCGTAALFISAYYFDRYSFDSAWAFVLVLPMIVPWERRAAWVISVAALLAIAWFSITSVHDYFAWNRARWTAYDSLRKRGVPADQIDGGLEIIGWEELVRNPAGPKWVPAGVRPYAIVFRPRTKTVITSEHRYRRWLGMWDDRLYVVRSIDEAR
jgi:hypothetical protein